jgi:dTDP-6-deoxy-L-talose 4-dehydrogenase (NAD+)
LIKILITGGQGFIAKNIFRELKKLKKYQIFATYRKNLKKEPYVNWIKVKNLKSSTINQFNFDVVLDLAWYDLDNYNSKTHLKQVFEHLVFYKKLIKNNKKINIFSFGTCLEYGLREGKLSEKIKTAPKINYAKGKDLLRKKIMLLRKKYNYSLNWIRLFYIYGEGQEKKKIYTQFINDIKSKKKFFYMSKGSQKRDYINIKKVVRIIIILIKKNVNCGVINLCTGKPISIIQQVKKWKKKFNSKIFLKTNHFMTPIYEPEIFYGSTKKLNKIIN